MDTFSSPGKLHWNTNQVLGRGSYGVVYRGQLDGAAVAVKKIPLNRLESDADRTELLIKGLDHVNLLKFYCQETIGLFRYMALELCVATLDDYCTGKYTGSMPTELDALQQMARGVDYIHSMQLIHGDIKPRNVLISLADDSSKVWLKIADFGCCKRLSVGISFSVSGIRKTPNFLAPELLELETSNDPSRKADVFSLGCTFYVFLTKGNHPFGHATLVVVNTSRGDYSLTDLPNDHFAVNLIEQMIQSNPSSRPSASAVLEQLESLETSSENNSKLRSSADVHKFETLETTSAKTIQVEQRSKISSQPNQWFPLDYVELRLKERPRSHPSLMLEQMGSFSFDEPTNELQTINVPKETIQFQSSSPESSDLATEDSSSSVEQEASHFKYRPLSPDITRNYEFQNATVSKTIKCYKRRCYGQGENGRVWQCKFHPTKHKLACAVDKGKVVIFARNRSAPSFTEWEKIIFIAKTESNFQRVDWNVSGTLVAAGSSNGTVAFWNEEGRKCLEWQNGNAAITCLAWNKNQRNDHLFIAGDHQGTVTVWDSTSKEIVDKFDFSAENESSVTDVLWISSGRFAASMSSGNIHIRRLESSESLQTFMHSEFPHSLRWCAEDRLLAACFYDGFIKMWNPDRSEGTIHLSHFQQPVHCFHWFNGLLKNKEVSIVASGSSDSSIVIWELDHLSKHPRILHGHLNGIADLAFAPNGKVLASVDKLGNLKIWSTQDWRPIFESRVVSFHFKNCLSWSSDGRRLTVANLSPEIQVVEFCKSINLLPENNDSTDC